MNRFFQRPFEEKEQRRAKVREWLATNNFCAMPYVHMAIEANGSIRPCCMGKPLDTNIAGRTVEEAFNDPIRQEFVDSFDRNEQHPNCNACWKDSAKGKFNTRIKFSSNDEIIEYTESIMEGAERKRELQWLEIKPGNRCNLKCRICGVHNSSQWTKDYYSVAQYLNTENDGHTPVSFKESEEFKYTESCKWIDDPEFWTDVQGLEQLNMIHFMGGEPFMVLEHFQMLEEMVRNPNIDTSKTVLRYNTNGTYFPTAEQQDILRNFFRVVFLVSVDDTGKKFEYQRKGASWEEVKSNLIKFKELQEWNRVKQAWQFSSIIDPTVSMFNIWNVGDIAKEFEELGYKLDSDNNHFVTGGWNDCRYLPQEIKDHIKEIHKDNDHPWVNQALAYMDSKPIKHHIHDITLFYKVMMYVDHLREEKFVDLWPEYYHMITQHINWSKITQYNNYKETKYEQKNL